MNDQNERKLHRKNKLEKKSRFLDDQIDKDENYRAGKHLKKEMKEKKQEIEDEENWEYWKEYYK